jgi:hypothetical protein
MARSRDRSALQRHAPSGNHQPLSMTCRIFRTFRIAGFLWGRIEAMNEDDGLKAMGQVIQIDEARIRDHLSEMVRGTVEETLNAFAGCRSGSALRCGTL